jgi:GT2 family glycosyltransferase/glycosyltransferase involved in cell wall biosynthesis
VELPCADAPRVTVIILAWRHVDLLRRCLASVAAAAQHQVPFEVIVLLNGASAEVTRLVDEEVTGARVVRSRVNLGFAGGCNRARREARGEFLLLLNDDAEVEPGWMAALVRTLDDHPQAGAVGSRVLFSDGTVQEAGCVIWSDGSTTTAARGTHHDAGHLHYLRRVDYCSACSLLVRASTWDATGGLDERYFPGYYEDVDLCLSITQLGQQVLYQPISVVRHAESASLGAHYKSFVFDRCKASFVDKWRTVLPRFLPPGGPDAIDRAVTRARGARRVLIIDDRLPNPSRGSGFGRMYETVVELLGGGWSVAVHASDQPGSDPRPLGALGVEVVADDLADHLASPTVAYDAIVVSRPNNYERFAGLVRACQPGAILVYDAEAVYHRRIARQIDLAEQAETMRTLRSAYTETVDLERHIASDADAIVAISDEEAATFIEIEGHAAVRCRSALSWSALPGPASFQERRDVLMVAGWLSGAASPNADGLRWFVRTVFPIVRSRLPWVRVLVTGADPPRSVRSLGGPNVVFLGHVPDLEAAYASARVVIAPIRFGAGVKLKTTAALEHGVPVVSTSVGAEGLAPAAHVATRVEDDPRRFAEAVVQLLEDSAAWGHQRALIDAARAAGRTQPRPSWPELLTWAGHARRARLSVGSVR